MGISVISLLKEDETDQAIEQPDEIMHINRDSETDIYILSSKQPPQKIRLHKGTVLKTVKVYEMLFVFSSENSSSTSAQN
ncbi:hypothetical protein TNCV_235071 [Trichonephila clavipes]|uniref:Uncharacterized protein n=1 Tax=Trichonephila clavipes TaxID=2585209 RepID=A0A8X6SJP3_TRICX|nr:hypothetical protein TNCV_235071 [Trichonephila clavipes]